MRETINEAAVVPPEDSYSHKEASFSEEEVMEEHPALEHAAGVFVATRPKSMARSSASSSAPDPGGSTADAEEDPYKEEEPLPSHMVIKSDVPDDQVKEEEDQSMEGPSAGGHGKHRSEYCCVFFLCSWQPGTIGPYVHCIG